MGNAAIAGIGDPSGHDDSIFRRDGALVVGADVGLEIVPPILLSGRLGGEVVDVKRQ